MHKVNLSLSYSPQPSAHVSHYISAGKGGGGDRGGERRGWSADERVGVSVYVRVDATGFEKKYS